MIIMKKLGVHAFTNVTTKLWSMISIYIFIPLYIKILGETSYGLVSFFATLQTTMNLLGLGLSNTLRREFAVGGYSDDNKIRKYKLLRSVELIYVVLSIIIVCLCKIESDFISENWLNIGSLDPKMVANVMSLMGVSIALQLNANLNVGCLFGLDQQVLANMLCIVWSIAKSVGSLLIIIIVSPNLVYFYGWHILIDAIYFISLRFFVIKKLEVSSKTSWSIRDFTNIKNIWKYTCGILFISFIALINKQLDKVIISKFLTLTELGAYNIATTLGSMPTIIPAALYIAIFPRFVNYATTNRQMVLKSEFIRINKLVNLIISSMGAFIAIYATILIEVWTGSESYVNILGFVGVLVVLAVTFIEYQEIPYALALANGNTKYNVLVGAIFIPIIVLSTYFGIRNWGLLGAGIVYLIMMIGQTVVYEFLIYKKYITNHPFRLIIKDTVLPFLSCLILAYFSKTMITLLTNNVWIQVVFAILCGIITLAILILVFAHEEIIDFKRIIMKYLNGRNLG